MRYIARIATLLLALSTVMPQLQAQTSTNANEPEPHRLLRYAPPYPFDNDGGYQLLRAMTRPTDVSGKLRRREDPLVMYAPWSYLLAGRNFAFGRWDLGIDGLVFMFPHYNKTDGLWLGYEVQLTYQLAARNKLILRSSQNYALRSKHWYSENHLLLHYAPELNALAVLSAGHTSRSSIHLTPEELYRGHYPEIIGGETRPEWRKYFISLRHRINPTSRLGLNMLASYEDRKPQIEFRHLLNRHRALTLEAATSIVLIPLGSIDYIEPQPHRSTPIRAQGYNPLELGLRFRSAIDLGTHYSKYQLAEASLSGAIAIDPELRLDYRINVGKYLNRDRMSRLDERFLPQDPIVGRLPLSYQWAALPEEWTAGEAWLMAQSNLYTYGLLLSPLKQVSLGLDEALHLRAYKGLDNRAYAEIGYSIGWGNVSRLGIFYGYDTALADSRFAVKLNLPISLLLSVWSERD